MSETTPESTPSEAAEATENAVPGGQDRMTRVGFGIVVALALVAVFWPKSEERINFQAFTRSRAGQAAPVGMLVDSGGRPIPIGTRMAPVTLVHFWATWCPPCITEIPSILRLADEHANDHNFSLLMIAVADDIEKARTFLGHRFTESLYDHDWKLTHSYGTEKVPETHLVVQGKIVESFIGATNWDQPEIRQRITDALVAAQADPS
ncbi:MAG: TlpA disulfide reductase family protein [Acidobacteriota bacterium]